MRIGMLVAVLFPAVMLAAGGQNAATKQASSAKPKSAQTAAVKAPDKLPASAERVDLGTWRYKDPAGKVWIYRQTPFGLVHFEEKAEQEDALPPGMRAAEDGDQVRFERPGPFGNLKWVKAKSELTDVERKVWERDSKQPRETGTAKPSEAGGK